MAAQKRFYERASTAEDETVRGQFRLMLDGKPVRTPRGQWLLVPGARLAAAIAAEWEAQSGEIKLASMPMTRLAMSLVDHVVPRMDELRKEALVYAATDLLCYRATAPAALAKRQSECWQPLLDWAREALGASLDVTEGVAPIAQPPGCVAALARELARLDGGRLLIAHALTRQLGSLILALAVVRERIDAQEAYAISRLDETFQAALWGEDDMAAARAREIAEEIAALARFLALLP